MHRWSSRRVVAGVLVATLAIPIVSASVVTAASSGVSRQIASGGIVSPVTGEFTPSGSGDATQAEFVGEQDGEESPDAYSGAITDRSLSRGIGTGGATRSGQKAKSDPDFVNGFEGLNLYQQRYARGGNQFTVEPPDQALCAGGGYVVEAVNDVFNVYDASGDSLLPDNTATNVVSGFPRDVHHAIDLNSFFGYAPAINRSTGVRAQSITDPTCLYDAATGRFFLVVLTLESRPNGSLTLQNHLDVAVSQTSDPTALWNIYRVDVTNDGSGNPAPGNACPCIGDYPHIGADANGFYVTTNAYPWNGSGFNGAQIYAFSKAQLAAGSATVTMVHLDTWGLVNAPSDAGATQPGFTVWPAQSPAGQFRTDAGGTEYFLSSNAADEATHPVAGFGGSYTSSQLVQWTLTNTSSLDAASPALSLGTRIVGVNQYGIPPKSTQPGSGSAPGTNAAQGYCLNDTTTLTVAGTGCWRLLVGASAHNEVISRPDANDTRMQQVTYANGRLWGALDSAVNPDGGAQRAGIAWFIVNPASSKVTLQGYLGSTGYDFSYPAIGVTSSGRGVMAFTATGDATYPSAAYAAIDANVGVSAWDIAPGGAGAAPDDGFTSYKAQVGNPPRTRWGDYGAAAVDGNAIWVSSEYVSTACSYTDWGGPFFAGGSGDNLLGTCAGAGHGPGGRTALGNWSTRISRFIP